MDNKSDHTTSFRLMAVAALDAAILGLKKREGVPGGDEWLRNPAIYEEAILDVVDELFKHHPEPSFDQKMVFYYRLRIALLGRSEKSE